MATNSKVDPTEANGAGGITPEVISGSGNVYSDLGGANAAGMAEKAQVVSEISRKMKSAALSVPATAKLLGMTPRELALILRGQFRETALTVLQDINARLRDLS